MVSDLPAQAYVLKSGSDEVILVKKGETGFYPTALRGDREFVRGLNEKLNVTPAQAQAMMTGSLFGWHVPGADPAAYEDSETYDA